MLKDICTEVIAALITAVVVSLLKEAWLAWGPKVARWLKKRAESKGKALPSPQDAE